jgi:hypothetical protein
MLFSDRRSMYIASTIAPTRDRSASKWMTKAPLRWVSYRSTTSPVSWSDSSSCPSMTMSPSTPASQRGKPRLNCHPFGSCDAGLSEETATAVVVAVVVAGSDVGAAPAGRVVCPSAVEPVSMRIVSAAGSRLQFKGSSFVEESVGPYDRTGNASGNPGPIKTYANDNPARTDGSESESAPSPVWHKSTPDGLFRQNISGWTPVHKRLDEIARKSRAARR